MTSRSDDFIEAMQDALGEPCKLTISKCGEIVCLVSFEDLKWAQQWIWSWVWDRRRKKRYARRVTSVGGQSVTIYLHKEILARAGKVARRGQTIGDHLDGDSLNNQRGNLAWATRSENNANRKFNRCKRGRFSS